MSWFSSMVSYHHLFSWTWYPILKSGSFAEKILKQRWGCRLWIWKESWDQSCTKKQKGSIWHRGTSTLIRSPGWLQLMTLGSSRVEAHLEGTVTIMDSPWEIDPRQSGTTGRLRALKTILSSKEGIWEVLHNTHSILYIAHIVYSTNSKD